MHRDAGARFLESGVRCLHSMYGEKVQDILAATEVFRRKGLYKGKLQASYLTILGTSRAGREDYALD